MRARGIANETGTDVEETQEAMCQPLGVECRMLRG